MTNLPFSYLYPKLMHPVFPTLRRHDRFGEVGESVEVMVKPTGYSAEAQVLTKEKWRWMDMPDHLLTYDTDTETREEALEHINQWYQNHINRDEELNLYLLKWVDPDATITDLTMQVVNDD